MQPTMTDVARLAGVSQATVSHVVNGTASISDNVVKKVQDAMRELGYVPSSASRGARGDKASVVGIVIPNVGIRFYGEIVHSIEQLLRQKGYVIFLCNTFYDSKLERTYVMELIRHRAVGVIAGYGLLNEESKALLKKHRIPTVMLDTERNLGEDYSVHIDNQKLARMAVSHLYDVGSRTISYCSEPLRYEVLKTRYRYFQEALEEFGLKFEEKNCFIEQTQSEDYRKVKMGYNIAANILMQDHIDAVFASSDEFAFGIISRMKEYGVDIPGDIQIMGCDNDPFSKLLTPSLTTIWQPITKMAEIGVLMLTNLMEGKPVEEREVCLEPSIVIRESTLKVRMQNCLDTNMEVK